jgi:hypothetical protein
MLPEDEAMYLAVVFEETGAWQYKKNKEIERNSRSVGEGGETARTGLREGFVEDFSFGEEDDNDYWDKTLTDEFGNVERAADPNAWE